MKHVREQDLVQHGTPTYQALRYAAILTEACSNKVSTLRVACGVRMLSSHAEVFESYFNTKKESQFKCRVENQLLYFRLEFPKLVQCKTYGGVNGLFTYH